MAVAGQQLLQTWRDSHANVFRRDTLDVLDKELSTMSVQLGEADHQVDRILRKLRDLGCDT
jgi:hypothetical protein